jgi:UDP-3-O-[3-hydroxymyristoyl] glucosamine N-acyltransferase
MRDESFISPNAVIHESTFIGSNVRILGSTIVGPNCYIDDNVVLGYPSKEALKQMINTRSVPTDLSELDKYSEGQTILSGSCCLRFGTVISAGTFVAEQVYCDIDTHIGAFCKIGERTQLLYGARLYNDVVVGADCRVGGFCCNRSIIEDKASMFGELVHSYRHPVGGLIEPSPVVRRGSTIGWHAVIIGGIEVGEGAYVAAGAIVTRSVPKDHIVVGTSTKAIPRNQWRGSLAKIEE